MTPTPTTTNAEVLPGGPTLRRRDQFPGMYTRERVTPGCLGDAVGRNDSPEVTIDVAAEESSVAVDILKRLEVDTDLRATTGEGTWISVFTGAGGGDIGLSQALGSRWRPSLLVEYDPVLVSAAKAYFAKSGDGEGEHGLPGIPPVPLSDLRGGYSPFPVELPYTQMHSGRSLWNLNTVGPPRLALVTPSCVPNSLNGLLQGWLSREAVISLIAAGVLKIKDVDLDQISWQDGVDLIKQFTSIESTIWENPSNFCNRGEKMKRAPIETLSVELWKVGHRAQAWRSMRLWTLPVAEYEYRALPFSKERTLFLTSRARACPASGLFRGVFEASPKDPSCAWDPTSCPGCGLCRRWHPRDGLVVDLSRGKPKFSYRLLPCPTKGNVGRLIFLRPREGEEENALRQYFAMRADARATSRKERINAPEMSSWKVHRIQAADLLTAQGLPEAFVTSLVSEVGITSGTVQKACYNTLPPPFAAEAGRAYVAMEEQPRLSSHVLESFSMDGISARGSWPKNRHRSLESPLPQSLRISEAPPPPLVPFAEVLQRSQQVEERICTGNTRRAGSGRTRESQKKSARQWRSEALKGWFESAISVEEEFKQVPRNHLGAKLTRAVLAEEKRKAGLGKQVNQGDDQRSMHALLEKARSQGLLLCGKVRAEIVSMNLDTFVFSLRLHTARGVQVKRRKLFNTDCTILKEGSLDVSEDLVEDDGVLESDPENDDAEVDAWGREEYTPDE